MIKNSEDKDTRFLVPVITDEIKPELDKMRPGSIKVFSTDTDAGDVVFRKQANGDWVVADGEDDIWNLTSTREDDIITPMSDKKKKFNDLIPNSDKLFTEGYNVLLIGLHGTGKTESIKQMADRNGLKMKYFSCSTLDPFTDLVGVPVPTDLLDKDGNPTGEQYLKMVRPHDVDEADLIFFDELNRADAKTLNAVFEIIQFRSINGDPLPNLKACWGAINPPDEDYDVDRLDAALLDRFDLYINIDPKPSVSYMSQFIAPQYAQVLSRWWNDHYIDIRKGVRDAKIDYISPRRLMKLGLIWQSFENMKLLKMALPQGGTFDHMKLVKELRLASESIRKGEKVEVVDDTEDEDIDLVEGEYALGQKAYEGFKYDQAWLRQNMPVVVDFLEKNQTHYETHAAISKVLSNRIGGEQLVKVYHPILEALAPSILESMFTAFAAPKQTMLRNGFKALQKDSPSTVLKLTRLHKVLGGSALLP